LGIARAKTEVNSYVVAAGPAQLLQRLQERRITGLRFCIVRCQIGEQADPPHALALLRAHRKRPRGGGASEQRDELASLHSITSSAVASSIGATLRPSIRAICPLMTSSNLVDCTTGRSARFAPLRMRPVDTPSSR